MTKMKVIPGRKDVRTTIDLPVGLWTKAKIRAAENQSDLKQLVVEGLELLLSKPRKRTVYYTSTRRPASKVAESRRSYGSSRARKK